MCGIVGIMHFGRWGISYGDREMFEQLLIADSLRGSDGTGAFVVDDSGGCRNLKIGADPYRFINDPKFKEFIDPKKAYSANDPRDIVLIGHNRLATTGGVGTEHAHPHKVGDILLVHNGTLRSYSNLPRFDKFDVDTQALTNAIDEIGIDETIAKTYGAVAIIYFNKKENSINVLRNKERPLHFAIDKKENRILWASEEEMLKWIIKRSRYMSLSDVDIQALPVDMLHTFYLDSEHPETPLIREVKGPKTQSFNRGGISWYEANEVELVDVMSKRIVEKKKVKKVVSAVRQMRKGGMSINLIKEHLGLTKGASIAFRVTDYADENPNEESFLIMGESPTLPKTSIRFRLKGEKALSALFEQPFVSAKIKNMLEYPEGNEQNDNFVIWVGDPEMIVPQPKEKERLDMYGRKLLPSSVQPGTSSEISIPS